MAISRDGLEMFLQEEGVKETTTLRVMVSDLNALADEWNSKRPSSVEVFLEQPYEIPTAYIRDPFGNTLALSQPQTEQEADRQAADRERVREHLAQLESGSPLPTADELARKLGVSAGVAIEILNEFR